MNVLQEELSEKSLFGKKSLNKECFTESEEWVVENLSMEKNIFSQFSLMNFLTYDLNCIPKSTLTNFANGLKLKILEKIMEFDPPYREQLEVLCKITDGSQTERNQNIITRRMLTIVNKQGIHSKHSSKLFNSQNAISEEELTSSYFSSDRKAENVKESEVKSSIASTETIKKDRLSEKVVTESEKLSVEVKTIEQHNIEKRIDTFEEEWVVKTPVFSKALNKTNDTSSTFQGEFATKSLTSYKTSHKRDYVDDWDNETPPYQKPSTKPYNATTEETKELTIGSLSSNCAYQEAVNKDRNSGNRATSQMDNFNNEEEWDVHSPQKNNSYSEFGEINKLHHNYSDEEWTYPVKVGISGENINDNELKFPANESISSDKHQNSNERRNESSNFAGRCMQRFFSEIRNEPFSSRSNRLRPAVKAEEYSGKIRNYPFKMDKCSSRVDNSTFGHFSLINLLNYDVDRMPSDELNNYTSVLKLRVLDKIFKFEPSYKEELEVLCDISDGNQTDRNQKIICSRICAIVNRTVPQWNNSSSCTISRHH